MINITTYLYKNSIGFVFEVSTNSFDLTDASTIALIVQKPSKKTDTWTSTALGTPSNGIITYTTVDGDLNEAGWYNIQAYVIKNGKTYYGKAVKQKIYDTYEVP